MLESKESLSEIKHFFEIEQWDELRQDYKLLENELGKFKTLQIHDSAEFTIREYSFEYKENVTWQNEPAPSTDKPKLVEISFFFNEEALFDTIDGKKNTYLPYHNYIYFVPDHSRVEISFEKNRPYKNLDIYVSLDFFSEWSSQHQNVDTFIKKIRAGEFTRLFASGLPINARVLAVLLAIKTCEHTGVIRSMYIKAKVLELLSVLFDLSRDYDCPAKRVLDVPLRKHELDAIFLVKEFLETDADQFYTIEHLSKKFNLNVFKLKKGFKEAFGVGLFEYANQWRMNKAMKLISDSEYSIKEIAFCIGYSTVSSFSSAFKKVHGVSPNKLRKREQ